MKPCFFRLRHLIHSSEHFRGCREVKSALRRKLPDGGKRVVGSVDVGVQGRELILERISYEALSGQVIALVGTGLPNNFVDAWKTFQGRRVEF